MKQVIKYAALIFALLLAGSIIGGCLTAGIAVVKAVAEHVENYNETEKNDIWYRDENGEVVFMGIHFGASGEVKNGSERFETSEITSLYLEGSYGSVEVTEWEQDYFLVEYENIPENYNIYNEGGTLTIVYEKTFFSWGVTFDKPAKISVRIPEGTVLKTAEVSNASGGMSITGISAESLSASNSSGSLNLTGVSVEKLFVDKGSGSANISDITAKSSVFDSGSGSITVRNSTLGITRADSGSGFVNMENVVAENLIMDSGSGRVDISGEITGNCNFDSGSGSVNIVIYGKEEEYNIRTDVGSGSFYLNGKKEKEDEIEYRGAQNQLVFDTGSGRVSLEFAE